MSSDPVEQAVATLHDLGLSITQAKVYMALVRSGPATIRTIASLSKVARPDLYRITRELAKTGLVEKILSNPTHFRPVPLSECIHILLQRRSEQTSRAQIGAIKILQNFSENSCANITGSDNPPFIFVPSRRVARNIAKSGEFAEKSADAVFSWNRFSHGLIHYFEKLGNALSRGVQCRFVIEKPEGKQISSDFMELCKKNHSLEVRFVINPPQTGLVLFDNREVFILEKPAISESPALWSNCLSLLSLAKDYFSILWLTAIEPNIQQV